MGILCAVGGFLAMGWLLLLALNSSGQPYRKVELDVVSAVHERIEGTTVHSGAPRLVYLGDSLSMPSGEPSTVRELRRMLAGRRRSDVEPPEIINISAPGLTTFSHYFVSDELEGLGADRFIVGVNLGWFSRGMDKQQPSMVGLLPVRRWPEALALPLHTLGISADEIILSRAVMHAGFLETWRRLQQEQLRFRVAAKRTPTLLLAALGVPNDQSHPRRIEAYRRTIRTRGTRPTAAGARQRLGPVLGGLPADDPNLAVLDALVARLRASGARVLLVVPPTNVEVLHALGVYDHEGIQASLARIRDVAIQNGADFLDLHALLPDDGFRDATDHLEPSAQSRPVDRVASQLVLWTENEPDWDRFRPDPDGLGSPAAR